MYLIFVMTAILFYSSISKMLRLPANWTLASAQFVMAAYYIIWHCHDAAADVLPKMDPMKS